MVQVLCVFVVPGLGMGIKYFVAEGIFCSGVCVWCGFVCLGFFLAVV